MRSTSDNSRIRKSYVTVIEARLGLFFFRWRSIHRVNATSVTTERASRSDHVQELSTPEHVSPSPPGLTFPDNLATSSYPIHNLPASPPAPPDIPLSHIHEFSKDDQHNISATSIPSSNTEEHVPTSQSFPLYIPTPPDKFHRTLSCWIENMNRLSSLIDRLQELASSAPPEHQFQLSNQVVALRATSQKQKEHFLEFLQLSEEYANKYLFDISAEIQQQSSFLDKLKERLEAAEKLRGDAIDLQKFYESGTVSVMNNFRTTGKAVLCRLQKQNIETFYFQHFRGRFQRTMPCSARWTSC